MTRDGGQKVFEVVAGTARMRPVTTGGTRRELLVVTDGLAGSETLVVRPPESLVDGTAVNVKGGQ